MKNGDVGSGRNTGRFASYIVRKKEKHSKGGPKTFVADCKMAVVGKRALKHGVTEGARFVAIKKIAWC